MGGPPTGPAEEEEHPRGTLAIVGAFGAFLLIGWIFFYFVVFAGRGAIH